MVKIQQQTQVNPPLPSDKALQAFTSVIQRNFGDLFAVAHNHIGTPTQKAQYAALTTDADRIAYIATLLGLI